MRTLPAILFALLLLATTAPTVRSDEGVQQRARFESLAFAAVFGARDGALAASGRQKRTSFTALFQAIAKNNLKRARVFAPGSSLVDSVDTSTGATPLTWAAQTAHPGMTAWLLSLGANLEASDGQGYTPLATAARYAKFDTVRLLLDRGALPDAPTPLGQRPLQLACGKKGSLKLVRLLVEHGANPHLADNNGWTPLAIAAKNGHADIVAYLLQLGAHPDGAPMARYTPLHWAAVENRVACAGALVRSGANARRKGPNGETPLSWSVTAEMKTLLSGSGVEQRPDMPSVSVE